MGKETIPEEFGMRNIENRLIKELQKQFPKFYILAQINGIAFEQGFLGLTRMLYCTSSQTITIYSEKYIEDARELGRFVKNTNPDISIIKEW